MFAHSCKHLREIVSNLSYYLLWLVAGLLAIAAVSAGITRRLRLRMLRRL
jgi:hypothetical protein